MSTTIQLNATLADLAVRHAGASRVFHRHGLDFCCHGQVSLTEACSKHGLDPKRLGEELEAAIKAAPETEAVAQRPLLELAQYILDHFHAGHREELPRLIAMARKVEQVHGDKPACPNGLAQLLESVAEALEMHMQKEEQVLFPLIMDGRGAMAAMPILVMEREHQDHGKNLQAVRELATNFKAPEEACNTWRALYLGLAEFEAEVMEHIHLENNALFPRALKS